MKGQDIFALFSSMYQLFKQCTFFSFSSISVCLLFCKLASRCLSCEPRLTRSRNLIFFTYNSCSRVIGTHIFLPTRLFSKSTKFTSFLLHNDDGNELRHIYRCILSSSIGRYGFPRKFETILVFVGNSTT